MSDFLKISDDRFGIFGKSDGQKSDGEISIRIWRQNAEKKSDGHFKKSDGQFGILRKSDGRSEKKTMNVTNKLEFTQKMRSGERFLEFGA